MTHKQHLPPGGEGLVTWRALMVLEVVLVVLEVVLQLLFPQLLLLQLRVLIKLPSTPCGRKA